MVLSGLTGVFAAGCLAPKVLEETSEHSPAPNPRLELRLKAEERCDVLVIYDEQSGSGRRLTRRGFYLFANQERLLNGKRPVFLKPGHIGRHVNIPVYTDHPANSEATVAELYAVSSPSLPWSFELLSRGRSLAECSLPEYGNWLTAKKFFLFPLAAAADAVGVGVAAGAVVGVAAIPALQGVTFTFP